MIDKSFAIFSDFVVIRNIYRIFHLLIIKSSN